MLKVLLNIAIILSLVGQLLMPSFAVSNEMFKSSQLTISSEIAMPTEMVMSDSQSTTSLQKISSNQSVIMDTDCDNDANCCLGDMSQCISHCHAIANAFILFSGIELTAILLTSTKVNLPLWVSTPSDLSSQNPPPTA
jgi:hypothetical protein